MGKTKFTAGRKPTGPVVLHLDRSVASDLLQALTQALEPHSRNIADVKKTAVKGRSLKATGTKSLKGKSSKGHGAKGKHLKGKHSKRSR